MSEEHKVKNLADRLLPAILVSTVALAFAVGILWQRVQTLQGGGGTQVAGAQQDATPAAAADGKLTQDQVNKVPALLESDHVKGDRSAPIKLIVYSDLECPYCAAFHPTAESAFEAYPGQIALVFRHFPLTFHPQAKPAAMASECVASLAGNDAFWSFIDGVFEDQENALGKLPDLAQKVGVNLSDFNTCVSEKRGEDTVDEQYEGGSAAGIGGTPGSFIINQDGEGWLVSGAVSLDSLKSTIDKALGK